MIALCLLSFLCGALGAPATYDQRQEGELNVRADLQNFALIAIIPKFDGSSAWLLKSLSKNLQARKGLKNYNRRQNLEPEVGEDREAVISRVEEPFLEPKSTYHVDISQAKSNVGRLYPVEGKSEDLKLPTSKESVESPLPDVVPVKDDRYLLGSDRSGKIVEVVALSENVANESIDDDSTDSTIVRSADVEENSSRGTRDSGLLLLGAMEQCGPDLYRDNEGICRLLKTSDV